MKTAYIFHDAFSNQYADWYPWLKGVLEGFGYNVIVPAFPTPAGQTLASWRAVIKNYIPTFDEETVLIGHGTGALFALRMAQESGKRMRGIFLVSGYAEKIGHAGFDRVNETFLEGGFPWDVIRSKASMIHVFAGQDDPYIPMVLSESLAKNLGVELEVVPNGEHFTKASGFVQFVVLADALRSVSSTIAQGVVAELQEISEPLKQEVVTPTTEPVVIGSKGIEQDQGEIPQEVPQVENQVPENPITHPDPTNPAIHTMYQDMGTLVNSNKGSVASSLLSRAREDEQEKKERTPTSPKNLAFFFATLVIMIAGLGVLGYVFRSYLPVGLVAKEQRIPSLIRSESRQIIQAGNDRPSYALAQDIRNALAIAPQDNTVSDIAYVNGSVLQTWKQLLANLDITTVPESLGTEWKSAFMHGSMMVRGKPVHFLILPVNRYDSTFRGMQEWESTLFRDVGVFMNVPEGYLRTKTNRDVYEDEMIANRNFRVLRYHAPQEITPEPQPRVTIPEPLVPVTNDPMVASEVPVSDQEVTNDSEVATTVDDNAPNFISEGLEIIQSQNPFLNIVAPYQEGDIMLMYFFLTEQTVVILDSENGISEILSRFANQQIYQ